MSIISNPFTYVPDTLIEAAQVNSSFSTIYNDYNGGITNDNIAADAAIDPSKIAGSSVPAGVIVPWWNTVDSVPTGWALCNGQTTTWQSGAHIGDSVTLPNLIGMYVQGSDLTGGSSPANGSGFGSQANQSAQGATTTTVTGTTDSSAGPYANHVASPQDAATADHTHTFTTTAPIQPSAILMPFIMKL